MLLILRSVKWIITNWCLFSISPYAKRFWRAFYSFLYFTVVWPLLNLYRQFYPQLHCRRIVLKASDIRPRHMFLPEKSDKCSLLCTPLEQGLCLHGNNSKKTGVLEHKLRSREQKTTNYEQAWAESNVTNLNICYGERPGNFSFTHNTCLAYRHSWYFFTICNDLSLCYLLTFISNLFL